MGIFSKFRKKQNFNLNKSDFETEKNEYERDLSPVNDEMAKSIAEWKKKNGYPESEKQKPEKLYTVVTNFTDITLFKNTVRIQYDPTELESNENEFIEKINQKLNWISTNKDKINDKIVEDLISLKNEDWTDVSEKKVSEKDFINKIKLTSILFFGDASYELNYDDGNLFYNHQIIVSSSKEDELTEAFISG